MSFETTNDYYSYFPYTYTPPLYPFYHVNSIQSHQLPRSFENSFGLSNDPIHSKPKANTRQHNRRQRRHSNATTRDLRQSFDYTSTVPRSSTVYRMNNTHRSDSHENDERQQFLTQKSIQQSSLRFRRSDTIHPDQQPSEFSPSIYDYCRALKDQSENNSTKKLTYLLNKLTVILENFHHHNQQQQKLHIINDILNALIFVHPSTLIAASQNEFFSILQRSFIYILRRWRHHSFLSDDESYMFRTMTKLMQILVKATDDIKLIPSWLSDSALLEAISKCLTDIATSDKLLDNDNKSQFKSFTYLIDAYIHYQQRLNDEDHAHQDKLLPLLDSIIQCLTSSHFIHTFTNMPEDAKSMTTIEKFFLVRCPTFLTTYNGSHLQQTMESLLSTMLSQYTHLLDKLVSSTNNWKRSMTRCVHHLLEIINHGADHIRTNTKLVSSHLSLIDDVVKLVNEPIFYNNLRETLSNPETIFMNTAISFLVNMISEPTILTHIKQCQVTDTFLRLTSCKYDPLVLNVYTLLAYTTREEDIEAMYNPGRLLTSILKSLTTTLDRTPNDKSHIEQLLETLKGLVQHDQIKDEMIKQNALPFLLECMNKLSDKAQILILEILWSLTFCEEGALALRSNDSFLNKIQTISKDSNNEPLKKAADGLVWKLIREPESLEKVAKQEEEQEAGTEKIITTTEVIIGEDGEKQVVTTNKEDSMTPSDRSYRYDIMISYCHADKELTYKIHKFLLDQGFKIWIDLDNMYGPAMSAMADAVENSEFVIMCMSDSYKQSTYCQAEAEYAFKCRRRLIPLIMREGYKPDGWLGFMIGSRIYIDFGRYDFEIACEKLLTEMNLQRKQTIPAMLINTLNHKIPDAIASGEPQHKKHKKKSIPVDRPEKLPVNKNIVSSVFKTVQSKLGFVQKSIDQWTESDVIDFLSAHRLHQLIPLCQGMNGRALIQLYQICISRRLRAYSVLKDELKTTHQTNLSLSVYSQFLSVMEQAINSRLLPLQSTIISSSTNHHLQLPNRMPFVPAPDLNMPYDFSITTNASALDTLKMVECYSPQLLLLDSLRQRITNVY